jgi:hypothetical protein
MARIGLPYGVFAPITSEPTGAPIVYGAPTVFDAAATGKMIEANVSYEHADNPLYGGDGIVENDNSITGGTLAVGTTSLPPAARVAILGHEVNGTTFHENADPSPNGGFWYVTAEIEGGVKKWYGYQIHKTQLAMAEDNATTKANSIEWQTPALEGPIMGVVIDNTGKARYRAYEVFSTYAAAKAWVDEKAGVGQTPVATPTATPATGEVASGATVELATATNGATIYYTTDGSDPAIGSMIYSDPIAVYAPTTIKAIAVKAGMANSAILSAAYTIEE